MRNDIKMPARYADNVVGNGVRCQHRGNSIVIPVSEIAGKVIYNGAHVIVPHSMNESWSTIGGKRVDILENSIVVK